MALDNDNVRLGGRTHGTDPRAYSAAAGAYQSWELTEKREEGDEGEGGRKSEGRWSEARVTFGNGVPTGTQVKLG